MGRLRVVSGRDVCQILARYGFVEVRRRGSRIVMQQRTAEGMPTIPVPNHGELKMGTLLSIIRQNGLPRSEFEA